MKKNKGFTLIELLGVITIFGILCALAIPPILNQVNKNKKVISDTNLKIIYEASRLYFEKDIEASQTYCVSLQQLVDRDLLESPIQDFANDKDISLSRHVEMTMDAKKKASFELLADGVVCKPSASYVIGDEIYFDPTGAVTDCNVSKVWTPTNKGTTCYKWNIVRNNATSIEMLLDHNTSSNVAWTSVANNTTGPKEVYEKLKTDTAGWSKVETLTAADNAVRAAYGSLQYTIDYTGMKARLIGGQEIADIANDSAWTNNVPSGVVYSKKPWLYQNTATNGDESTKGYWTDTVSIHVKNSSYCMNNLGVLNRDMSNIPFSYGVRPVVRVLKSNIK